MNTVVEQVYYLGSDSDFLTELKIFCNRKSKKISCKDGFYSRGCIIEKASISPIDIIFVDLSETSVDTASLIEEVIFLKRIEQLKSILFIALLKDEAQKTMNINAFTSGFQLCHIKSGENEAILRDAFYIGFRKKIEFPTLALAKDINKELQIGLCSTLTSMNKTEFCVETDANVIDNKLSLSLPMFPDLVRESYDVKVATSASLSYPMTSTYTLNYPFPGPWEDESEATLHPETLETWLDNFAHEFDSKIKAKVSVYSSDLPIMKDLFDENEDAVEIDFSGDVIDQEVLLLDSRPSIIFLNLDDEIEGKVNLDFLNFLLSIVSSGASYNPIMVVSNSPSSSSAIQKVYNYPMIVATPGKLDSKLFLSLVRKFQSKRTDIATSQCFRPTSTLRTIDIFHNFMITSLTEHEITFYGDLELPMFSILHFQLPIEFHATIIPSIRKLDIKSDKFHYMAFIHGLSEDQLMVLRKFVNQIIYSPLDDFSSESVKKKMGEALANLPTPKSPVSTVPVNIEIDEKEELEYKKPKISGKSKL